MNMSESSQRHLLAVIEGLDIVGEIIGTKLILSSGTREISQKIISEAAAFVQGELVPLFKRKNVQPLAPVTDKLKKIFSLFDDRQISAAQLESAISELILKRDSTWENRLALLHINFGRTIDDLKFDYYRELEKATGMGGDFSLLTRGVSSRAKPGTLDIENLLENLERGGDSTPIPVPNGNIILDNKPKEQFIGTSNNLKILVPPKVATVEISHEKLKAVIDTSAEHLSAIRIAEQLGLPKPGPPPPPKETHIFHLTFPQQEVEVPASILLSYMKEILHMNLKPSEPELPAPNDGIPEVHLNSERSYENMVQTLSSIKSIDNNDTLTTPEPPTGGLSQKKSGIRSLRKRTEIGKHNQQLKPSSAKPKLPKRAPPINAN